MVSLSLMVLYFICDLVKTKISSEDGCGSEVVGVIEAGHCSLRPLTLCSFEAVLKGLQGKGIGGDPGGNWNQCPRF